MPSIPLNPEGVADDRMLRLPNDVLPAVDKVVELRIADPKRVFLMGQSFGGFSTYGLVIQTDRFAAAVSLAGLSDLISLYGQFDARMRYTDHPQEHGLFRMALAEAAQTCMGGPPWKDLGRYIRNSTIFQVDRVNTPLMIIQGDVDYVATNKARNSSTRFIDRASARVSCATEARVMSSKVRRTSAICGSAFSIGSTSFRRKQRRRPSDRDENLSWALGLAGLGIRLQPCRFRED